MTDSVPLERRLGDRRRNDRRVASRSMAEESWFGALGVGGDTEIQGEASAVSPAATDAAIGRDGSASAVSDDETRRSEGREARRVAASPEAALRRVFRTYVAARALLGLLLAAVPWIASLSGGRSALPLIALCVAYGVQSVLFWLWPHMREGDEVLPVSSLRRRHWIATIGVDLCVFAALHLFDPLANLNFGALLVLPVLMAGVMTPRPAALATAAAVALVLLAGVWRGAGQPGDVALTLTQAGLAGIGIFMIALLAGELSGRLAREERAARGSLELARQQAQLNRLVIEEMTDGVLVVDRRARVRAANPAARALLAPDGLTKPAPFQLQGEPAWSALSTAVEQAFAAGEWPESARLIRLQFANDRSRTVQLRARFTRRRNGESGQDAQEEFCVVFLDDLRNVQARVQKEKLAAMGRVSAGIAHEIRNPLAAIAQANALLLEDALPADQHRLARMVADNVERLKRIVDDVMAVAPGAATENRVIDATAQVDAVSAEWSRAVQTPSGPGGRLRVELPDSPIGVRFDGEHLRRVLTNLLDNARRHASDAAGAIELRLAVNNEQKATLAVASDGEPIRPDVERFLFEPFFSTRSRGTGLGLYICRELCARYGATIEYRPHGGDHRHHNEFVITMQREVLPVRNATTP
ncbi:MAG: histidine kinase [Burkholderiaceae bacterium]|jgi:two-component system sensor histidine kinase PilS (NtrC family)|nr:histidine kinase [Burkholderiaceae bacterium]